MIRTNSEVLNYLNTFFLLDKNSISLENFAPKQKVIEQSKRYSSLFIVKQGITKCFLSDEKGKDFIQEFLGEGMLFGEIEVFSDKNSFCTIEAITPLEVYKMSYSCFNKLLEEDNRFNRLVIKALATKISYKAPRHSYQHSYAIEDNVLRLQKQFPDLIKVISKQDIANYLGITIRSLNRTLNKLKEEGILNQ